MKKKIVIGLGLIWVSLTILIALPSMPVLDWLKSWGVDEGFVEVYEYRINPLLASMSGLSVGATVIYLFFNLLRTNTVSTKEIRTIQETTSTTALEVYEYLVDKVGSLEGYIEDLSKILVTIGGKGVMPVEIKPITIANKAVEAEKMKKKLRTVGDYVKTTAMTYEQRLADADKHLKRARDDLAKATSPMAKDLAKLAIERWINYREEILGVLDK